MESLVFDSHEFKKFLNFAKLFTMYSLHDSTSRSVSLSVEDSKLVCRATDGNSEYVEFFLDIKNKGPYIQETLILSLDSLLSLSKVAPVNNLMCIRNLEGTYQFEILGDGWFDLQIQQCDIHDFKCDESEEELGEVLSSPFKRALSDFIPYIQGGQTINDTCIIFNEHLGVVSSLYSGAMIKGDFAPCVLQKKEALLLKTILPDDDSITVSTSVGSGTEHLVFSTNQFKLYILTLDLELGSFDFTDYESYLSVDYNNLMQLAIFSNEDVSTKRALQMSFNENSGFKVLVRGNKMTSQGSTISSRVVGSVESFSNIIVSSEALIKNLRIFSSCKGKTINIVVEGDNLIMFDSNTQAICNLED